MTLNRIAFKIFDDILPSEFPGAKSQVERKKFVQNCFTGGRRFSAYLYVNQTGIRG